MKRTEFNNSVRKLFRSHYDLVSRSNVPVNKTNGIYTRYKFPILTRDHVPPFWIYDLNYKTNPDLLLRLGVNTTFNAGAIKLKDKFYMVVRTEGFDVKSFFSVVESPNGIDKWKFKDYPIAIPLPEDPETNIYDMRLTHHEDGWIYGLFCVERKDISKPGDSSAAMAACGIARTKDLSEWERLPDLKSSAAQQRNCVLHPEYVDGRYMIYTRPQSGFIDTGDSGISVGFTASMLNASLGKETIIDLRQYHTVKEVKNGQGPPPLKTKAGWINLAHGVRRTAAGLRYTLYLFLTDLQEPWKVIKRPSGHFMEPLGEERIGDVSNVLFSNGWIANDDGSIYIYYASSDTRMHIATTTVDKLIDYIQNTPEDAERTDKCVKQRRDLIYGNLEIIKKDFPDLQP